MATLLTTLEIKEYHDTNTVKKIHDSRNIFYYYGVHERARSKEVTPLISGVTTKAAPIPSVVNSRRYQLLMIPEPNPNPPLCNPEFLPLSPSFLYDSENLYPRS